MSEGSGSRRHLAAFVLSLPLGIFVGDVIASTPNESVDFTRAGRIVLAQAKRIINAWNAVEPPAARTGTWRRSFVSPWINEREYGNSQTREASGFGAGDISTQQSEDAVSALKGGTVNMLLSGLPEVAGRIEAGYEVSANGAGTYSIPIWTPAGARGIQPKLSLNYSSSAEDWLMGPGWRLGGLSVISRCPKTVAQDGYSTGVSLITFDRFCLDGNQLRLTSGTYGAANSTYQTDEGPRGLGESRNIDFFIESVDPTRPHITFRPQP